MQEKKKATRVKVAGKGTKKTRLPDKETLKKLLQRGWEAKRKAQEEYRSVRTVSDEDLRLVLQ